MELKSKELFEAVKKEYPELSASEVIAFVRAECLAHIAENTTANICSEDECGKRLKTVLDSQSYMGGLA